MGKPIKQPLKRIIYSQNAIRKSRGVAFFVSPIMLAIVILQYFNVIASTAVILKSNILIMLISVFLIISPKYILLWAVMSLIAFFVNIYVGGHLLGLFFYCFAVLILLKHKFFSYNKSLKLALLFAVFITAFYLQYSDFGMEKLKESVFNIFVVLMGLGGIFILFADDLKNYFAKKATYSLSQLDLSDRQKRCFKLASQGLQFEDIAKQICVSESVVKKEMLRIYELINVKNKAEFLVFSEKYEIVD